jgi:hypothetical protein
MNKIFENEVKLTMAKEMMLSASVSMNEKSPSNESD